MPDGTATRKSKHDRNTMQTVLFHSTVFGPIHSRRLGVSLGINLMPNDGKICSFDCLYCEAGFNAQGPGKDRIPTRDAVKHQLHKKLRQMSEAGEPLDVITFSGNGEPTLHPEFKGIVADVLRLRTQFYPDAKVSVLSNSTMAARPDVRQALLTVDNNILKLDSAVAATMRALNRPASPEVRPDTIIHNLAAFGGQCIVQTMLLRGEWEGTAIDNTTDTEVEALIDAYRTIAPREVMLYSIDRTTPAKNLQKVDIDTLRAIARRITEATGIPVQVN